MLHYRNSVTFLYRIFDYKIIFVMQTLGILILASKFYIFLYGMYIIFHVDSFLLIHVPVDTLHNKYVTVCVCSAFF